MIRPVMHTGPKMRADIDSGGAAAAEVMEAVGFETGTAAAAAALRLLRRAGRDFDAMERPLRLRTF